MFDFAAIFTTQVAYLPYRLIGMLMVSLVLGLGITLMLDRLGEKGPRYDGRATVNPFAHLDWGGFVGGLLLRPGWAMMVRLRAGEVRGGAWGILLSALVPLAVLILLAGLLLQLRPVFFAMMGNGLHGTKMVMRTGFVAELMVWCALVNLIPLPPFLMGHLWAAWAPSLWTRVLGRLGWISGAAFVVVLSGLLQPVIAPAARFIIECLSI